MLVFNFPPIQYVLFLRFIQVIKQYTIYFQEKINIYDDLIDSFIDRIGDFDFLNKKDLTELTILLKGIKCYSNHIINI